VKLDLCVPIGAQRAMLSKILPRMRSVAVLALLALGGCATGNIEDDEFFNRGWLHPKELDTAPPKSNSVRDSMPPEERR
jgi:hypothetical protein